MQHLFFLIISLGFFHISFAASAVTMISSATAVTPRNADGTYPVWVSPDLGVKSPSTEGINAALERKFWDNSVYQQNFRKEIEYLKAHQNDDKLYQKQLQYYKDGKTGNIIQKSELGVAPSKENSIPTTCSQVSARDKDSSLWVFEALVVTETNNKLAITPFLSRADADCQALRLLLSAKPTKQSFVHDFVFTKNFTDLLPALMTPDDVSCSAPQGSDDFHEAVNLGALPENQKKSWSTFYQFKYGQKNTDNFDVKYLSPINVQLYAHYTADANSNLRLLAKGDFLNKGSEQLLMATDVDRDFYNGDGGAQASTLFLLDRQDLNGVLEILYPEKYIEDTCDPLLSSLTEKTTPHGS